MRLQGKRSKYGVRIDATGKAARTVDGILFDSLKEARRYAELKLLGKARQLTRLELQRRFDLVAGAEIIGSYVADFCYLDCRGPGVATFVVEDVKGFKTPLYRWKKKHVEAQYNITITEI